MKFIGGLQYRLSRSGHGGFEEEPRWRVGVEGRGGEPLRGKIVIDLGRIGLDDGGKVGNSGDDHG